MDYVSEYLLGSKEEILIRKPQFTCFTTQRSELILLRKSLYYGNFIPCLWYLITNFFE